MENTSIRLRNGGDDENENENEQQQQQHNNNESNRLLSAWHHSSRIYRVSRATGGKDRHSKVLTSKGLRDRRVRLSVSTAIQFYDLQDRLGYDQPSKAVEWLIKAAEEAISELPSLDTKFSEIVKEGGNDERARFDVDLENDGSFHHHKSACSSTSETSKGSVLSLSRSENRVKARERARERTAKDKDKEPHMDECECPPHQHNSQNSSFTELLNSGAGAGAGAANSPNQSAPQNHPFFLKQTRPSPPMSMDYFSTGLFGSSRNQFSSGFSSQPHFGTMTMPQFNVTTDPHPQHHHPELQQFSFLPDHLIPESQTGSDYNLNFSISSGLAGYNRGTLQSNSPSTLPPHFQRFTTSPADGSNIPFYATTSNAAAPTADNQFPAGFNGRLQLYYDEGSRHSDTKGKEKS